MTGCARETGVSCTLVTRFQGPNSRLLPKSRRLRAQRHFKKASLAIPGGLEPPTCRLEGDCSIQLSYGTAGALVKQGGTLGKCLCHEDGIGVVPIALKGRTFDKTGIGV